MTLVEGDGASVSAFAARLARRADRLAACGDALLRAVEELDGWAGPEADDVRSRLAAQGLAAADAAAALRSGVAVLQGYAVDLGRATAMARHAESWCAARGLVVGADAQVRAVPGVLLLGDGPGGITERGQWLADAAREHAEEAAVRCAAELAPHSRALAVAGDADAHPGVPADPADRGPGGRHRRH